MNSYRYDWGTDPTAQDVVDALRVLARAQPDHTKFGRLAVELIDWEPETDNTRGMDLVLRLIAETVVKVELNVEDPA